MYMYINAKVLLSSPFIAAERLRCSEVAVN